MDRLNAFLVVVATSLIFFASSWFVHADNARQYAPAIQEKLALIDVDHHSLDDFKSLVSDFESAESDEQKLELAASLNDEMTEAVKRLEQRFQSKLSYSSEHVTSGNLAKRRAQDAKNSDEMSRLSKKFRAQIENGDGLGDISLLKQFSHSWHLTQSNEISEAWSMMLAEQRR